METTILGRFDCGFYKSSLLVTLTSSLLFCDKWQYRIIKLIIYMAKFHSPKPFIYNTLY